MEFLLLASAHFLALISPGPDFFLILQSSLRHSLRQGVALCAGIATANGIYLALAIGGIELLRHTPWIFTMLRYLGAIYLIFVGVMLLRTPRPKEQREATSSLPVHRGGKFFIIGMSCAIFNPKNMIFYLSLFTVMVAPTTPFFQRTLYGVWMMGLVFLWDCLILKTLKKAGGHRRLQRHVGSLEKFSGGMLTLFGICLLFAR